MLEEITYEVYVISGKAYMPSTGDPSWANVPAEEDYLPTLSNQLHDLEGFSLWLDLLPKGSLTSAGSEQSGGFSVDKYTVNGLIGDQVITGALSYDQASHALVKSELRVPAVLDSDPEAPEAGEIVITLSASKADIPPITIPSDGQAAPLSTALTGALTTPTGQAPLSDEPVVINTFTISDMPYHPGGAGGVVLALPGQLWTADKFSGLQLLDPQTGAVVQAVPLEARLYHDLKMIDQRLWVLATRGEDENHADVLYLLDLPSGEVVETIPITNLGSYGFEPAQLGVSPGKVWVNSGIVDTGTLEFTALPDGLPSGARFAYDGASWMWITGSWCYACEHDLWIMDAVNPPAHKDGHNSGVLGTGTLGSPLALAGGRMWVLTIYYVGNNPTYYLDAYDLAKTDRPALHIDVTDEIGDANRERLLVTDDHMLWMEVKGKLYYYDNLTGEKKGELTLPGEYVESMSFDGTSLWVLSSDTGLHQVYLPWQD
ncbi:MAG: hypothetical protein FIA98_11285 [Anaerolineae bacterium]|nr:hypothetical protein [Anaerolineae bacterium]